VRRWRLAVCVLAAFIVLPVLLVLILRFAPPPTTAFMLASDHKPVDYRWVPMDRIAPVMALAAVASEDQKFPIHHGFDFEAMREAAEHNENSRHVHGASTISQQTAKNLFLWSGRSYVRKGIEAGFTVLMESLWPKRRILEMYLNVAQFGPGVYGVEAAAKRYFGTSAARLDAHEAALLAASLPNPDRYRVDRPSGFMRERADDIEAQIAQLGSGYLDHLR